MTYKAPNMTMESFGWVKLDVIVGISLQNTYNLVAGINTQGYNKFQLILPRVSSCLIQI